MKTDFTSIYMHTLATIIQKHAPECTIYLFGSRAAGTQREGSDIDIGLDAGKPISWDTLMAIQVDIDETTIPVTVDLIDIQSASPDIINEILKKGIVWQKQ